MPPVDLHLLEDVRRQARDALAERQQLADTIAARGAEIEALRTQANRLESTGKLADAKVMRARVADATAQRTAAAVQHEALDAKWRTIVDRLRDQVDPCDADPDVPLVLLPVRLETRYTPDRAALRVRIYPDDIHIDQLDRGLGVTEIVAGKTFWLAAVTGAAAADAAWPRLCAAVGDRRAPWVALALRPTNFQAWRAGEAAVFPDPQPSSRRAALARLLPDRFVAVAIQGVKRVTAVGNAIAPEVVVGLLSDDGSEHVEIGGRARVHAGARWLFDYERAVEGGLGITVRLATPGASVTQLFVVGARSTLKPDETAQQLGALFESHRCTRGLAFVPQGTATNNTADDSSAWSRRAEPKAPTYLFEPAGSDGRNAAVLASALGIDTASFDGIDRANDSEQPLARAMSSALWPATLDTFLDRATEPDEDGAKASLSDRTREAVRALFRDAVRGRGPLPAIRIGSQPYGFLPVSDLSANAWAATPNDPLHTSLLPLLRSARGLWEASIPSLPRMGAAGGKIDETFAEILGSSPISRSLRVRTVIADDAWQAAIDAGLTAPQFAAATEAILSGMVLAAMGVDPKALHALGFLETKSRPLAFPMVHKSDAAYMNALLAGTPPAAKSVLQALLNLSLDAARRDVDAAVPPDKIHDAVTLASTLPPATRNRVLAVIGTAATATARTLHAEADFLAAQVGESGKTALRSYAPVQTYRLSLFEIADSSSVAAARATIAAQAVTMWMRATARLAEVREAIQGLTRTSLEQRRILLAETLDVCSHRLDAWLTALVEARRAARRANTPAGLTIGAFGWVENIVPGAGLQPTGGYVHAPTLDHAATAGILRSAHLTHNPAGGPNGPFAVDLSSARVRSALHLIDGMRRGQPIGALLGYRIERRLHEARLDRLILTLRGLAPLTVKRLSDRHDDVPPAASEILAASNVIDGVRLIERFRLGTAEQQKIKAALAAPPPGNPYVQGQWPALSDEDWDRVCRIVAEAEADCDASSDLLLAESVHQLVRGNTARAAAALNAAGGGDTAPPEPEFIRTPNPGVPYTHRVLLIAPPPGTAWNAARPRAAAEPSLEAWAATRLGPAQRVVVATLADGTRVTLDATGLAALDFVYESADRRRLEQRVRAALPALPANAKLAERRDSAWPKELVAFGEMAAMAAALRAVLTTARPALPGDFSRPNDVVAREASAAALAQVRTRAVAARDALDACRTKLAAAIRMSKANTLPVATTLEAIAAFGVVVPMAARGDLLPVAQLALDEAERRLAVADGKLAAAPFDMNAATAVAQAIFGDGFWMLPAISVRAGGDLFSAAFAADATTAPRSEIRRYLRDVGTVRPALSRLSEMLLIGDALGRPSPLRIAQLCPAQLPWIGGVLKADQASSDHPITSVVLDVPADYAPSQPTIALAIDQWTDVVPLRTVRRDGEVASADDRRTTGIALNAGAASSRPPQAVLLAVSPDGKRWTTDALTRVVQEALALAKIRGVTLERVSAAARVLPALYQRCWSLQGEKAIDWRFVVQNLDLGALPPFVREVP